MALPWMKRRSQQSGISIEYRKPDSSKQDSDDNDSGLDMGAEDLIRAIEQKDKSKVKAAIRAMFEILDSEPHEEGPHTNEGQE